MSFEPNSVFLPVQCLVKIWALVFVWYSDLSYWRQHPGSATCWACIAQPVMEKAELCGCLCWHHQPWAQSVVHPPCLPRASSACPTGQPGPSVWSIPVPKCMWKLLSNGLLHCHALSCLEGMYLGEHQLPEAARGCQCGCKKTPKYACGRYNKPYLACSLTSHKSASSKETHSGLVFILRKRGCWSAITTAPSPQSILRALWLPGRGHYSFLRNVQKRMPLNGLCKILWHILMRNSLQK